MAETYRGTYNPDKKRGELLKDNMATGDYYSDLKAAERAAKQKNSDLVGKKEKDVEALNELKRESRGQYTPERFKVPEKLKAKGGAVKYKKGGSVSASKRADGCAQRGKTRGKMV